MTIDSHHHTPGKRARMHERVSRVLLQRILRGELPIGTKLATERALASEFQVNRATVREALRYLETLELIAIRQGDGAYVKNILDSSNLETAKAVMQVDDAMRREVLTALLEIRRINSPEVAYAAALNRTPAHLQQLEQIVHYQPDIPILERDKRLHHVIGQASGNILQMLMTNFYENFFDAFGHLYFNHARNCQRSEEFHRNIYLAIHNQNAGMAREMMRDVLQYAEQAVLEEIGKKAKAGADTIGENFYDEGNKNWSNQ